MVTIWAFCASVLACFLWYNAQDRRRRQTGVTRMNAPSVVWQLGGWAFYVIALFALISNDGPSRGTTMWLGLVTVGGVAMLVTANLSPKTHRVLGVAAGVITLLMTPLYVTGVMS